jgi:transcriptional regulator with XRE-family HTH domain
MAGTTRVQTEMRVRDLDALRAYIDLLGLSARELAGLAGLGHATVSHLLSGRRSGCARGSAVAIESALGVRSGIFFEPKSARL